jgi:hypothetical protein
LLTISTRNFQLELSIASINWNFWGAPRKEQIGHLIEAPQAGGIRSLAGVALEEIA